MTKTEDVSYCANINNAALRLTKQEEYMPTARRDKEKGRETVAKYFLILERKFS